ncbi:hypothetical protein [Verminephrobacter eiseniae]|uniref:hypothetical protein n=1 Tax=Verminephrobacter eiseniae TaxID=364317 RepID=UPI00223843A3|nr:hypothetical protein [Verminephrobacter eiseniae]MCW5238358.1 hypothetical protein [Verminephrobacter eiseniae]
MADNSRHASTWAASVYAKAKARGCDHPHAIRILARTSPFTVPTRLAIPLTAAPWTALVGKDLAGADLRARELPAHSAWMPAAVM